MERGGSPLCLLWCRWVEEYHVDGFRFDLASVMCRDELGRPLESPPIVREIAKDPILSKVPHALRDFLAFLAPQG